MSADPLVQMADAVVVPIAVPEGLGDGGLGAVWEIAAQLPDPATLPAGTMVALADKPGGPRKRSVFERMTSRSTGLSLHRAARCTALISRGYVGIGGGTASDKTDWAWGYAPRGS